jgi:P4 family phage/plasmid primase-like protien
MVKMEFSKYVMQYMKDTDKKQTHLSFNKGKYNVPDDMFDEFVEKYYEAMVNNVELYLIEKVYNSEFCFFMDIDAPKDKKIVMTDNNVLQLIEATNDTIKRIFCGDSDTLTKNIVSKRMDKYHVNYPNIIVNGDIAKKVCEEIAKSATGDLINSVKCIDTSVYRTGLRMLGSKKKESAKKQTDKQVYRIYDLQKQQYTEIKDTSFELFKDTLLRKKVKDTTITQLQDPFKTTTSVVASKTKTIPVKGIDNSEIVEEVSRFLKEIKSTNESLKLLEMNMERIYARQNKLGMFCYFVSLQDKHCPFKDRDHKRDSSPIYVEIGLNGIYIKCHDEDCLRMRFPEGGINFPEDWMSKYKQMYLSMSTKYWKAEVSITNEIKKYLEDSLIGSHYQVAKTTFNIYKDRFRVDDVKNTTWYEFDGIRWKKSHSMNLLVSEELPKYYKGIKISDTSVQNNDLQQFLVNTDKMDANLRNQMVDNIISKLENMNFKSNILNQVVYLYQSHDPDFSTKLDSNPYLIGFKNGVYDFKQNTFRTSTQNDYITFSTGYDFIEYDENNQHVQEVYDFLDKILTNRKVKEYLLKVLGKTLLGLPDERFYIWTGISGANGKSTLVNLLEATLGDYTTSVDVSLLTNKRANSGNASPDVVRLRGKRLFTFQEPEHDDKLRTGLLKQYTGGDTIIARELFKSPVTFKLQGTMVMCCNDLPTVASIDGGTWRRIRVIEFKSRFCDNPTKANEFKIDPSMKYKLQEWRPYFMSILIHWYNKYLYEGLNEPEEVKKATNKYKVDNDKFNEFFDQCLEESETFESNKSIYSQFISWWSMNYPNNKPPEIRELRRAMKIKYGTEQEKTINGVMYYGFNVNVQEIHTKDIIEDDGDL